MGQSPNETDAHCRSRAWVWCPVSKQGVSLMPCILDPRSQIPDSGLGTLTSQPTSRPTGHGEAKLKMVWKWYENGLFQRSSSRWSSIQRPEGQPASQDARPQISEPGSQVSDPRSQIPDLELGTPTKPANHPANWPQRDKVENGKKWKNAEKMVFVENDMNI